MLTTVDAALNLEALSASAYHEDPFPWAVTEDSFAPRVLEATFPDDHFEHHAQRKLLKAVGKEGSPQWHQHNVRTRPLLELGADEVFEPDTLDEAWLDVARVFLSKEYRDCVSDTIRHDVRGLEFQAHFWRFGAGSFFVPHVDKAHKIVTHLCYFSSDWTPEQGGCLQLQSSPKPEDVKYGLPPKANTSVLLRRTDNAWHAVTPISMSSLKQRLVLQLWFWEDP